MPEQPTGPQEIPQIVDNSAMYGKMLDIQTDQHKWQLEHKDAHNKIDSEIAVVKERQKIGTWLGRVFMLSMFSAAAVYVLNFFGFNIGDTEPPCHK